MNDLRQESSFQTQLAVCRARSMIDGPYDSRAIANLMLDEADQQELTLSNLAVQKLLYFAHGTFLSRLKRPLLKGHFEAWQYGPVHPLAYKAFKSWGASPILGRAEAQDALSGKKISIALPSDADVRRLIRQTIDFYGHLSPGRLVDLSHAKNAPWHFVVDKGRTSVAFGLRIPDDVILERFKYHKVSVGETPVVGEPSEDSPFT